ncbi:SRPBCC family protein [Aquamicrobium sp.]|uniref:SRPBCC family protein n=1 Tax=Aquamicrobium sp. TaxID=1872579 RepID=UPI00258462AA|nr:SRPBCC family protein [Aquamicrobium sp.]MCK9552474.1 SRPBCC domain-containing protein [Aquamicrobium sp.]
MQSLYEIESSSFFPVSPDTAWSALIDPAKVQQYMFGAQVESSGVVGGPISYRYEWEGKVFFDRGTITALEPPRLLAMTVARETDSGHAVPDGHNTLAFEVRSEADGCRVLIRQGNNPTQELADRSKQNWDVVLGQLGDFLKRTE